MANEIRRRKLKEENGRPAHIRKRKEPKPTTIHKSFLCLILSGTILTLFIVFYADSIPWHLGHYAIDSIAKKFGYHKPVHGVVIDAGSTGTRVLAFTFHESYIGGYLLLDKELFKYTKPGISSFVDNPKKAVDQIAGLLEEAKKAIPNEYWKHTPLILRATAGLRLLPQEKAENLLNTIKEYFVHTPFLTNEKSVEIMDGTDEGVFSWFTVNFLLDKIMDSPEKTVAALDLGGGSTQVTFSALTPASLQQKKNIHQAVAPHGPIPVYTNSFLGLGLMAARQAVITVDQPNQTEVTSECINHIINRKKFHFANKDYFVSGPKANYSISKKPGNSFTVGEEVPVVNFDKCLNIVENYVAKLAKPPEELPTKTIFAFSYYFDRAVDVGLIDETTGGQIKVKDFKEAAKKVCHEANADQPFMCLDLTFIAVLLEKGFGLSGDTKIYLYKKIRGHEISWALGAAYNLLRG